MATDQTFGKLAPELLANGYKPIPTRKKSKLPWLNKRESWQVDITEEVVTGWASNGRAGGGVALTGLCAIDCDCYNKAISNAMVKYILNNSDIEEPLFRIGQPPKFLLPCHADSAIEHKHKNTWYDPDGQRHEIEFLAAGDQYFLAYGIHPDTGQPFRWLGDSPMDRTAGSLPRVDEMDIAGLEDEWDRLCCEAGFTRDKPGQPAGQVGNEPTNRQSAKAVAEPLGGMKQPGDMADPSGIAEMAVWLGHLPAEWACDRDQWIKIGAAVHHETAGSNDGWLIWDKWSKSGGDKYKGRKDTMAVWESYDQERGLYSGDNTAGRGSIIHVLQQAGVWKSAEKAGAAARDAASGADEETAATGKASEIVKKLNGKYAVIRIGSKIRIMQEGRSLDGGLDLAFLSPADFQFKFANRLVPNPKDPKKQISMAKLWINSPARREYDGVVFEPTGSGKTPKQLERYYNIWKGLAVKPAKGCWTKFENHIYNVIAGGDDDIGQWVITWIARMLQQPGGERPGTSLVLRGGQGTGKGVFVNAVGKLFGEHFMPVSHAAQVTGRFNSHLNNKILVFIDEGFWAGDKASEGVLKSMITEPYLAIEQKGIDIIKIKNNINLIIASNNEWVVPANVAERRFCVLDVDEAHQQDRAYFHELLEELRNGGLEAMLYDLLKLDLKTAGVDVRNLPSTTGLLDQKKHSMSSELAWWLETLIDGSIDDPTGYITSGDLWRWEIPAEYLYQMYTSFCKNSNERYIFNTIKFGLFLKKVVPGLQKGRKYVGGRKIRYYVLPDLVACRDQFESIIKQKIDWGDENIAPF